MSTQNNVQNGVLKSFLGVQKTLYPRLIRKFILFPIAAMGVDLAFVLFMTLLLIASVIILGGHIRFLQASIALPLIMMAGTLAIKSLKSPQNAATNVFAILRDWLPFLFIAFIYENMHDIAGRIDQHDIAQYLYRLDEAIFGIQPTIWAERLFSPLLTDIMSISYALYFAFPLAIMFFLSLSERRREFKLMVLSLSFAFVVGFVCYALFPCSPPRYFMENLYTNPHHLTGLFLYNNLQNMWDGFSVIRGGAFPSLHVGISTVALIYAYKFRNLSKLNKVIWFFYIPLVTSLWFSTIYLRHHWFIDIIAGWLTAFLSCFLAEWLIRNWVKLRPATNHA